MAVKFSSTSFPHISAPDNAAMTFPNGDWSLVFFMRVVVANPSPQWFEYIFSSGTLGGTGTLNLVWNNTTQARTLQVYFDSGTTPDIASANTFTTTNGWFGVMISRSGTTLSLKTCPILAGDPTDGSFVVSQGTATINLALNGTGFFLGARSDLNVQRYYNQELTRLSKYDTALTDLQFSKLCYGYHPSEISLSPIYYVRLNDNTDTTDQIGAITTSVTNSLTTVSNPSFGKDTAGIDTITITGGFTNNRVYRGRTTTNIPISGNWTNQVPNRIDYRIYEDDGVTVKQDWTTAPSPGIVGATWSFNIPSPIGGFYKAQVRSYLNTTLLAESTVTTDTWGVGLFIGGYGSSSSVYWFEDAALTPLATNGKCSNYNLTTDTYSRVNDTCPLHGIAQRIFNDTGLCCSFYGTGVPGTTLASWSTGTITNQVTASTRNGGTDLFMFTAGSNDANAGSIISYEDFLSKYNDVVTIARNSIGDAQLPVFIWSSTRRSASSGSVQQWNWCREVEKDVCKDEVNNVFYACQSIDYPSRDGTHLTKVGYYDGMHDRMGRNIARFINNQPILRGPRITHIRYQGNKVFIYLDFNSFKPQVIPTSAYTGFFCSDDSGNVSVTSSTLLANNVIELTLARAFAANPVVRFLNNFNPTITTLPKDPSTNFPAEVETDTVVVLNSQRTRGMNKNFKRFGAI